MWGGRLARSVRFMLKAAVGCVALVAALAWLGLWRPSVEGGGAEAQAPPDVTRAIEPLGTVPVPGPQNLGQFVKDKAAGVALGKALFWDMQVGSDGATSCATCHFDAGADGRSKNQLNPRVGSFVVHQPNDQLTAEDFPFHRLADPADRPSDVLFDTPEGAGPARPFPPPLPGGGPRHPP